MSERSERRCDIPKTLSSKNYGARSDDSGQTREFTQCTANEPDFAESTAHGGKTASDLAPVVLSERSERRCDITKGFGCDDHTDGGGNVVLSESSEQTGDRAHLGEGSTHGGKALADLLPAHVTELLERIRHHFDRLGHSDERTGRLEVNLGVAQPLGGSDEFGHGATHAGKTLTDLIPIEISYGGHGVG